MRLLEILEDENGKRSSTRLIMVTTLIVFAIAGITDVFTDVTLDSSIYSIIQTIFGFGLGGQAVRTTVKNLKTGKESNIEVERGDR